MTGTLNDFEIARLVKSVFEVHNDPARWGATENELQLVAEICRALIPVESGRNQWAVRYEPGYRWTVADPVKPPSCGRTTEFQLQSYSWGLCQIMGAVARELGHQGWLTELLKPSTNVFFALYYLVRLGDRWGWVVDDIISSYNQGSPRKDERGFYENQLYVNKVKQVMANQRKDRESLGPYDDIRDVLKTMTTDEGDHG